MTLQRQLRALDALAEQSGDVRVRFFAAPRRGMHALLVDDLRALLAQPGVEIAALDLSDRDTIHTGVFCRYLPDPDRPVRWVLDRPGPPPGPD